jgi:hypothetical protein
VRASGDSSIKGVEVGLVNNQATLMRNGRPLVDEVGTDLSGLMRAEKAVAVLAGPSVAVEAGSDLAVARFAPQPNRNDVTDELAAALGFELPATATADALAAIRVRLRELAAQWRPLEDGACWTQAQPLAASEMTWLRPAVEDTPLRRQTSSIWRRP